MNVQGEIRTVAPETEAELAEYVADCHGAGRKLRISGGSTRLRRSAAANTHLTTQKMDGIALYEPGELTLIARAGTPLEEIERQLAAEGQALAFEPMDHRVLLGSSGMPTIGGMVAANVSGPRRVQVGACRDYVLGVRFVDGRGRILKNGGRVMKNVTGMDLGKLLCGSYGTLGVLTEVALKTLPVAECQRTLVFENVSPRQAVEIFSAALATPFEVSGAAFHSGTAWVRIEGLSRQVDYRQERLVELLRDKSIEAIGDNESRILWRDLRDLRHFANSPGAIWRILVKSTDAPQVIEALGPLGGAASLDWGGGLLWYAGNSDAAAVRKAAAPGVATLVRPAAATSGPVFPAESKGVAELSAVLRRTFDPGGIMNPGLMEG
nr:FAD-binding protein [Paracoccus saliphilus]